MLTIIGEVVGENTLAVLAGGLADPAHAAAAARMLETLTPAFKKSDPPGALLTELTWPTVVQLSHTYGSAWQPEPRLAAWIREQVIARTTTRSQISYTPPAGLTPYHWQVEGAALIADNGGALITDEPGTGKTITTILGLCERVARLDAADPTRPAFGPVLVVCPASVVDSWVSAWQAWAPHVRAVAWRGAPAKRQALLGTADVYVTSYDLARVDAHEVTSRAPLVRLGAAAVVIDECHFIKNATAARTKAVLRLAKAAHKRRGVVVGLSGTPITRDTGDLHPMLQALTPAAWPSKARMMSRYVLTVAGDYREEVLGLNPHTEPEFRMTLLGQHRRVAKADVLADLPPKVYTTRTVDMPARWRKVYDEFEADMYAELPDGTELSVMDAMSLYSHLSALSSAAADVEVTYGPDVDEQSGEPKRHVHLELKAPSWKVDALLELLAERRGRQTIVFAPSRQLIDLAGKAAAAAGHRVGYVVGGQTPAVRTADVDAFQARELDVICVTTKAGGVGLTLTAADAVVFLQRPWELDESIQAEDRAHRIGAEHESIEVIDIVARNTIDERRRDALRGKVRHLAEIVNDPRLVAELLGGTATTERKAS